MTPQRAGLELGADEAVLIAIDEANGIEGTTNLQKVMYFVSVINDLNLNFGPHYYGPFSREVEKEVKELKDFGLVEERKKRVKLASKVKNHRGEYVRHRKRSDYTLTPKGEKYANHAIDSLDDKRDSIQPAIQFAEEKNWSTQNLSKISKIIFLVEEEGRPWNPDELSETANKHGWELDPEELRDLRDDLEAFREL